jgi:hypothetical protein
VQVFEYLTTDLKKFMDSTGKGPKSAPMPTMQIKVSVSYAAVLIVQDVGHGSSTMTCCVIAKDTLAGLTLECMISAQNARLLDLLPCSLSCTS